MLERHIVVLLGTHPLFLLMIQQVGSGRVHVLKMAGDGAPDSVADKEYTYLGRSIVLLEEPTEDQVCQICGGMLDDPQQIICCGNDVCNSCLTSWLDRNNTCPFCRKPEPKYFPDKRNDRAVKNLKGNCPFAAQGCNWQGELRNLPTHLKDCVRGIVKCRQCRMKVSKGDLDEHNSNSCPKRPSRCQYCGEQDTYEMIHGEHAEKHCPRYPIFCPNMCDASAFPRCDLKRHQRRCPLERIHCKYADLGCPEDVIRCEMKTHCETSMASHLSLSCDMVISLAQRLQEAEKRLLEAEKRLTEVEKGGSRGGLTTPLSFFIDWGRLINSKMWLSPTFIAQGCSYRFQLRASVDLQGRSTGEAGVYTTTLYLLVVDGGEGGEACGVKCAVTLVNQSEGRDHVSAHDTWQQLKVNEKLAAVVVSLSHGNSDTEMYDTSDHGRDMLDMLFDDSSFPVAKKLGSFVQSGQLLARVEVDPIIMGGSWYPPPTSVMQS